MLQNVSCSGAHTSPVVLPDTGNMGKTLEFRCCHAYKLIYTLSYALPVYGGHFVFVTYADVGQFSKMLHRIALNFKNVKIAFKIVLLSCVQLEI